MSYLLLLQDGLRNGYKLEEIQVATELQHNYQRPSDFLAREWNNYVERTMFLVNQLSIEEHKKRKMTGNIGNPDRREIIQYLIEEGGNCDKAAQKCCASRLKMVHMYRYFTDSMGIIYPSNLKAVK